ncbi:MAG TPA: NAD-dependent succinate-semialdehyde dehydrogenase [Gammaproteobacteria bacterium]|nr:NAD-dependent succinate-semialdehyde dehydrogenase [Gammaproteobacteria bacterium]
MFDVINPATGKTVRQIAWHDADEIERKLAAAEQAFTTWRALDFTARGEQLETVAKTLRAGINRHAGLMTEEMGKPVREARGEVEKTAKCCEHYAQNAARYLAPDTIESDAARSWVQYLPLGTVLGILPWNSPYWLAARVFAPALMAGNTVIIKHDSHVPGCALAIEAAFREAGAPDGLLQVLIVDNDRAMNTIRDRRIHAVSFTGSTRGGRAVASVAAGEIKPAVLELGGSDPAVVLADSDLAKAVDTLATSRFICAGQSCIAAKRILVEASVYEPFIKAFQKRLEALKVGDPTHAGTDIGPLARAEIRDQLHDQVTRSIKAGAKCLLGGTLPEGPGSFYPVTLLADVPLDAPAFSEETFGPVAAVRAVDDAEQALAIANDTEYGLAASIWTTPERGEAMAARFEAGQVAINGIVKTDPRLPSGGIKCSGYGRELGPHGIHEFVNAQQVWRGN